MGDGTMDGACRIGYWLFGGDERERLVVPGGWLTVHSQVPLALRQWAVDDVLVFVRQLLRNVLLHTPKDERPDDAVEATHQALRDRCEMCVRVRDGEGGAKEKTKERARRQCRVCIISLTNVFLMQFNFSWFLLFVPDWRHACMRRYL